MFNSYYEVYAMEAGRRGDFLQQCRASSQVERILHRSRGRSRTTNLLAKLSSGLLQLGSLGNRE